MLAAVPSDREPKFASALSPKERRALRQTSEPVWHSGDGCAYMAPVAPPIGVGPVTGGEHLMPEWAEVRRAGIERAERTLAARSDIAELVKLVVGWLEETRPSHSSSSRGLAMLPATGALASELQRMDLEQVCEDFDFRANWIERRQVLGIDRLRYVAISPGPTPALCCTGLQKCEQHHALTLESTRFVERERRSPNERGQVVRSIVDALSDEYRVRQLPKMREEAFWIEIASKGEEETVLVQYVAVEHRLPGFAGTGRLPVGFDRSPNDLSRRHHRPVVRLDRAPFDDACEFAPETRLRRRIRPETRQEFGGEGLPSSVAFQAHEFDRAAFARIQPVRKAVGGCGSKQASEQPASGRNRTFGLIEKAQCFGDSMLDALMSRGDAVAIGWLWLERLIFEGECRGFWRCDRQQGTGVVMDPLMILIRQLAARLDPRADRLNWIRQVQDLWRVHRVAAVLAVGAGRAPTNSDDRKEGLGALLIVVEPPEANLLNC